MSLVGWYFFMCEEGSFSLVGAFGPSNESFLAFTSSLFGTSCLIREPLM